MGYMLSTNKQYDGISAIDAALDADALFTPQDHRHHPPQRERGRELLHRLP